MSIHCKQVIGIDDRHHTTKTAEVSTYVRSSRKTFSWTEQFVAWKLYLQDRH